ncbi:WD domain-containing protein [Macroventuria anomochaeta]|uniref:WD domain-containing protein n=1 Tax=Macroventuria anomochaeta TaxID=301207 RepID=A0ACB6RVA0_9PLEO|nr:WD domain-containing protein [Macroventuria anomochaeta]KAF2625905.1 WD domain-containing protein [Macroventuria anomochaeta]
MSPTLHHESTHVPVTALASCGALLIAAEGPFLRFYHAKTFRFITSRRVFKAQAVHGISVYAEELDNVTKLVVWGGRLVRALRLNPPRFNAPTDDRGQEPMSLCLSNVVKAPDWILDLAPRMSSLDDENVYNLGICAAVTAHNALLELTIQYHNGSTPASSSLNLNVSALTASSRSILYSAHLLWESSNCILVAAGTAFGEIMYWSWSKPAQGEAISRIHQVFLGHEGSIFDVRISKELQRGCCGNLKRVIASCSDDRTIRLWDVSNVDVNATNGQVVDQGAEAQRTRHTGFSVAATEAQSDSSNCLAIGWGHTSRVWKVRFLDSSPCDGALALLSAGEDATSRAWKLVASTGKGDTIPCTLQQTNCAAYHNGKNIWSMTTYRQPAGPVRVACGAADSKLTTHPLLGVNQRARGHGTTVAEYTVHDLLHMAQPSATVNEAYQSAKASKKADSIRSYCFILSTTFLLVTNSGKILVESFNSDTGSGLQSSLTTSTLVDLLEDLSGYSTCTSVPTYGVAFLAGTKGSVYMYSAHDSALKTILTVTGKVGSLFATDTFCAGGRKQLVLLVTLVGQKQAQLVFIDITMGLSPLSSKIVSVPVSDILTGSTITSMSVIETDFENTFLFLGFRRGSIGLYTISQNATSPEASLFRIIEKVHGDETITAMKFKASPESASVGHLFSVGRDGCLAVHLIDLSKNTVKLVHDLTLPIGLHIEGLYFQDNHLLVHGFSSKKWVLYDITSEEEVMGIETGGAHRSWAFQSRSNSYNAQGGTLVWTRASSLHVYSQEGSNHGVIRPGGHGREIKAVAVSPPKDCSVYCVRHRGLIATGAEDTDIKIFQYANGELVCRRTLRKHTTGIQHLQWSDDCEYLFSSAGSEEFYVWRIRTLDTVVDIGVICEFVYTPESEFSDLRIMSFDVSRCGSAYTIAMVFSDSSIKTYRYDPTVATKWQPLAKGTYFTSCLTQCTFLSPTSLLTAGTDGHAVLWSLSSEPVQPSTSALKWHHPARIHQNASKAMSSHVNGDGTTLIVSGGDDGALAFLLACPAASDLSTAAQGAYASPPVLVNRAHGSAITACTVVNLRFHIFVLTSGNDEWVRLWEVVINDTDASDTSKTRSDKLTIKRLSKVKTSVADVSSMAVVDNDGDAIARVLVCGVGMEVIRLDLSPGGENMRS